jgi:hypothetical protein
VIVVRMSTVCIGVLAITFASMAPARAEDTKVVVLPFAAADEELGIYGKPVADAVAKGVDGKKGLAARAGGGEGSRRQTADLVVELRVTSERNKLRLEGLVRDPDVGENVAAVSARPVTLGDLDRAAGELARKLVPKLDAAAEERRRRKSTEAPRLAVEPDATEPEPGTTQPDAVAVVAPAPDPPTPTPTVDDRPTLVVYEPDGEIADGAIPARGLASAALHRLVASLGYRALASRGVGVAPTTIAAEEARKQKARATIMLRVKEVEFTWSGVLTARGRVRMKLVSSEGKVLLDRVIQTDTLVGSRGDRHDALVRFVLRQAMEIVSRDVAKALK